MTADDTPRTGAADRSAVTREEVVDHVRRAFAAGPAMTADLVDIALRSGARPAVIEVLRRMPERRFEAPGEVWFALSDLPIDG